MCIRDSAEPVGLLPDVPHALPARHAGDRGELLRRWRPVVDGRRRDRRRADVPSRRPCRGPLVGDRRDRRDVDVGRGTGPADRLLRGLRSACLLYTSDAADERSSVDLGGRRII